ncbi:putative acyl-CoA dehydrogenase [Caenibius tardaugens NBRC 16725]|uniref:Putative acyl-CoA dehydrogenase n=1 Tax=Caenibius tardaugens NBRC 16725 TaxID=1219035 RepID=U2ZY01_9SPHN|nr:acyl-CoA dehydrogenase family protein [Caenibius tardaugens]GAD47398.1 putative acyl-CoA dehydrogenase [Caenibius tardaugens NBRC 16725]
MQFTFNEEETLLQESVSGFLASHGSSAAVRSAMDSELGYDPVLWRAIVSEMGMGGIAFPARLGGAEMGHVGLVIAMMEMGRVLLPSPYFSSIALAAQAILNAGTEAQQDALLPAIITGDTIATLAWRGVERTPAIAVRIGQDGTLNGEAGFVPYAHVSGLLVVAAKADDGKTVLAAIPADSAGVTIERHVSMDLTRPLSTVRFAGVAVAQDQILGGAGDAAAALERTLDLARIALAAENAGGAEGVLDMTVAYTKDRVQFGRPIGSFQALKHRMADMMVEVETAKTGAYYAACVVDEGSDELAEAAAIANSYSADAFMGAAGNAIQLHGGIGFTWEYDAHLFFKRARANAILLGDPSSQRVRIADMIGVDKVA